MHTQININRVLIVRITRILINDLNTYIYCLFMSVVNLRRRNFVSNVDESEVTTQSLFQKI